MFLGMRTDSGYCTSRRLIMNTRDRFKRILDFEMDLLVQEWVSPRTAKFPAPKHHGTSIITDEKQYDELKRNHQLFAKPSFVNFDKYKAEHDAGDCAFWFTIEGFFWFPRTLFGIEDHLYAFYDYPELIKRINQDQVDYTFTFLEDMIKRYQPEFMTMAEDMSYNNGAMLSESQFDEFMLPYYQQIIPLLKKYGVKVFIDSDGDITECINWFKRAGIEGILPLERQAGVDINQLRENHPEFLFLGGFDKTIMHKGEVALRKEFERLMPAVKKGGYLISVDHQIPPSVSLKDYYLYLKLFREYAQDYQK
ncbi:MAG: uroporphyrinogen decarboxylase family protein [Lentisphaerota bacterium]